MAAFSTCGKEGLTPHVTHAGRGVFEFAVAGSKFAGTGLENEQIVQTHVAVLGLGVLNPGPVLENGLAERCTGDEVELREGDCAAVCGLIIVERLRLWMDVRLGAFGCKVILGEDFKKPACM